MLTLENLRKQTLFVENIDIEKWGSEVSMQCLVLETAAQREIIHPLFIKITSCSHIVYQSLVDDEADVDEADVIAFEVSNDVDNKESIVEVTANLFYLKVKYTGDAQVFAQPNAINL
jgi:hypothetical protein